MLDGIYLEKIGIPCAVISTEAFSAQCRMMASVHSFDDYPFVEVFHPIANVSSNSLDEEACRVLEEVEQLLVSKGN